MKEMMAIPGASVSMPCHRKVSELKYLGRLATIGDFAWDALQIYNSMEGTAKYIVSH
jgi:hypothetical protein